MSIAWNRSNRIIILVLFVLLAFWKIVFTHRYTLFSGQDLAGQYYPWYQFAGSSWKGGSPPLWDPYIRGGRPFYDEMQAGAFHPFNILMFLAPASNSGVDLRTMDLLIVFSTIIACLGEYSLLRGIRISTVGSLVGGTVYGLSGYSVYVAGHQAIFEGIIWLPWICLFFLKSLQSKGWDRLRDCTVAGFFLGLTILAGHIQPPAHASLILGFLAAYHALSVGDPLRKRIGAFGALAETISFGLLVAAVQWIPTYLYSLRAYRWIAGVQLEPSQRVPFSLHEAWSPAENLSLLVPTSTSHMFYLGVVTLLLAVYGGIASKNRYRSAFGLLAVLSFLYNFGQLSAIYSSVYLIVPFAEKVPEAPRSFFMFHFAMAGLAGLGADLLSHPVDKSVRRRYRLVSNFVTFMSAGVLLVLLAVGLARGLYVEPIKPQSYIELSYAAVILLTGASLIVLRRYKLLHLKSFKFAMVGLVAFDLISFVQSHIPPKGRESADAWYSPSPISDFLRSRDGLFRVFDRDGVLPPNFGDAYRIQDILGYGATLRKDLFDFLYSRPDRDNALRMLNVRYQLTTTSLPGLRLAYRDEKSGAAVYEDTRALPRLGLIPKERIGGTSNLRLAQLLLDNALTCGQDANTSCFASDETRQARIVSYEPQRILVQTKAPDSAYLWLSELTYPGWEAYVDGTRQDILISDGIFRAVNVAAGEHRVEFLFRPGAVIVGLFATAAALMMLLLVVGVSIYRSLKADS